MDCRQCMCMFVCALHPYACIFFHHSLQGAPTLAWVKGFKTQSGLQFILFIISTFQHIFFTILALHLLTVLYYKIQHTGFLLTIGSVI